MVDAKRDFVLRYSVPILAQSGTGEGKTVGICSANLAISWFADRVRSFSPFRNCEVFFLTRDGSWTLPAKDDAPLAWLRQRMLARKSGESGLVWNDIPYTAVYTPMTGGELLLGLLIPRKDIFGGLDRLTHMLSGIGLVVLLLAAYSLHRTSKIVLRPLNALEALAGRLARGELDAVDGPEQPRSACRFPNEAQRLHRATETLRQALHRRVRDLMLIGQTRERIFGEMEFARSMQEAMRPKPLLPSANVEIAPFVHRAGDVCGDMYDYFFQTPQQLCCIMGNAAAHGVPAALLTGRVIPLLHELLLTGLGLGKALEYINSVLGASQSGEMHMSGGPQSFSDEARKYKAPRLRLLERRILAGEQGEVRLAPVFGGDATPWPLPWQGPTSLAYYPMKTPGWYLALLVSSEELGDAPQELPLVFILMAILGPLCIGCMTWFVTSRTLRPLHHLASSLEGFARGDLDAPVPKALFADEIGRMLETFESVRVTVRASFRNLVNSAAQQQRIRNELDLARNIQRSMLPREFPQLPWARVHAITEMCREVCGDLNDCFVPDPTNPQKICCVVGDVCGKGIPAALIMSRAMSLARAFLLAGLSPAQTLERINDALARQDTSSMFVTMLVGILDQEGGFVWASAGHPPPILGPEPQKGAFGPAARLAPWPGELVLGVRPHLRYATHSLQLRPGQSVLLYTDGADEAQGPAQKSSGNPGGELFGDVRLAQAFSRACRETRNAEPQGVVDRLLKDINRHMPYSLARPSTLSCFA